MYWAIGAFVAIVASFVLGAMYGRGVEQKAAAKAKELLAGIAEKL